MILLSPAAVRSLLPGEKEMARTGLMSPACVNWLCDGNEGKGNGNVRTW